MLAIIVSLFLLLNFLIGEIENEIGGLIRKRFYDTLLKQGESILLGGDCIGMVCLCQIRELCILFLRPFCVGY